MICNIILRGYAELLNRPRYAILARVLNRGAVSFPSMRRSRRRSDGGRPLTGGATLADGLQELGHLGGRGGEGLAG